MIAPFAKKKDHVPRVRPPSLRAPTGMDSNQEIRTLILVSTPFPPIPIIVQQYEDRVIGDDVVRDSHTVFSMLLEVAVKRDDAAANNVRRERQEGLFDAFFEAFDGGGDTAPVEKYYDLVCDFTRRWIHAYMDPMPFDARFMPMDSVCVGDAVHRVAALHAYVQDQYLRLPHDESINTLPYPQLLARSQRNLKQMD